MHLSVAAGHQSKFHRIASKTVGVSNVVRVPYITPHHGHGTYSSIQRHMTSLLVMRPSGFSLWAFSLQMLISRTPQGPLGSKRGLSMLGGFPPSIDLFVALLKTQSILSPLCANIYRVLACLAVLPVTSAEGKHSFSQLQRLKTFLREGNHGGRAHGRASFDAVLQAAGDPARPGPAGPQVCKASAAAHDPGEHLSGIYTEPDMMLTVSSLSQLCTKSQFSFDRDIDFLDFAPPKHHSVAINVGLLALFWWFRTAPLHCVCIRSFGAVYIAKSYDVCMKTTWKLITKIPSRCYQNTATGLQKSYFSWGGHVPGPKPPRLTRLRRVVCLWHTACLWHAKPPLQMSGSAPRQVRRKWIKTN